VPVNSASAEKSSVISVGLFMKKANADISLENLSQVLASARFAR
jgi:hypothetical protein